MALLHIKYQFAVFNCIQIGFPKLTKKIISLIPYMVKGDTCEYARFSREIPPYLQISVAASVIACIVNWRFSLELSNARNQSNTLSHCAKGRFCLIV